MTQKHLFLSHSSADAPMAQRLCDALEWMGCACWIAPRDIGPGQNYGRAIIEAIADCAALIVLVSENANNSDVVASEVERAASKRKAIIPCLIDNVKPETSLELFVSSAHWIDLTEDSLEQRAQQIAQTFRPNLEPRVNTDEDATNSVFLPESRSSITLQAEDIQFDSSKEYVGLAYPVIQTGHGYLRIVWDISRRSSVILKNTRLAEVDFPIMDYRYTKGLSNHVITPTKLWREGEYLSELLELVKGWTLSSIINLNTGIYGEVLTQWSMQLLEIAKVLEEHNPPLVHRDVKPSNIMVRKHDLSLVLIDTTTMLPSDLAKSAKPIGSKGFAAPEIGVSGCSPVSDLYSIGCTIYAMNKCAQPPTPLQRQSMGVKMTLNHAEEEVWNCFDGLVSLDPATRFHRASEALEKAQEESFITKQGSDLGELLLPNGKTVRMQGFF